jgi:hypothetical protein
MRERKGDVENDEGRYIGTRDENFHIRAEKSCGACLNEKKKNY